MLFSSGGLTKVLHRLQQDALIERHDNPGDKRSKLVQLTEKGQLLVEKMLPELHQKELEMLSVLNTEEQTQLSALLNRIMDKHEPDFTNR